MVEKPLPAYHGDEQYVFVSYSHEDNGLVFPEIRWLQDQGFNVWFDEGISPGNVWRDELADAIDRCGLFLFFVTPASVASRNCQRELGYALDSDKQVLAVHLEETTLPRGLTLSLADQQAILAYRYASPEFASRLVEAIRNLLDAPATTTQAVAGHHHSRRRIPTGRLVRQLRIGVAIALPCAVLLGLAGGWLLQTELAPRGGKPTVEVRRLTDRVGLAER